MTMPGRVYIRYLPPIKYSDTMSKTQISALLRRKMLECMIAYPQDCSSKISYYYRLQNLLIIVALFGIYYFIYICISSLSISWQFFLSAYTSFTITVTLALYLYEIFLSRWLRRCFCSAKILSKD